MGAADEKDEPGEDGDDLQGLAADEVERRLVDSVKSPNDASYVLDSSFFSVPESNFDSIEVSSDSDFDSDPVVIGAEVGTTSKAGPHPGSSLGTSAHIGATKPVGKREAQRAQEHCYDLAYCERLVCPALQSWPWIRV
ncbi:hypothetical protein B0H17DRAFT_1186655 [Mycena rosella]|uniref:Uncharacterized protein n=1 Tax=Mycena rosella TaxID=1033263 RepID=A0AAD7CI06_MYCRO|nr:hypothetical protein B0H17DRAFT_1186655 [Mycena rosella]